MTLTGPKAPPTPPSHPPHKAAAPDSAQKLLSPEGWNSARRHERMPRILANLHPDGHFQTAQVASLKFQHPCL